MAQTVKYIGVVGRDPQIRQTKNGKNYAETSLAVAVWSASKKKNTTMWIQLQAYGEATAQFMMKHFPKGKPAAVTGVLAFDEETGGPNVWTDKQGNARASFTMFVDSIEFLPCPKGTGAPVSQESSGAWGGGNNGNNAGNNAAPNGNNGNNAGTAAAPNGNNAAEEPFVF